MGSVGDLLEILDLNKLLMKYVDPLMKGVKNLTQDIIVIASIVISIVLLIDILRNRENMMSFVQTFFERMIKFSVLLIVVKSFKTIINASLKIFIEIGVAFGGDRSFITNDNFNFNYIWGQLGEMVGYIAKISLKFNGGMGIFYGLILLIVIILAAVIILGVFAATLAYYFVSVFMFLTMPMNLFVSIEDLSKQIIKTWVISGLAISVFTTIIKVTTEILKDELTRLEGLNIAPGNNDVIGVMMFILLLGLILSVFLSINEISNFILKGHGPGFTYSKIGMLAQTAVNTTVNAGLIALAVYTGGTSAAAAGARAGASGAKAAADAEKTRKTFSDIKNARRAARAGGNAVNKGVSSATDSEHKKNTSGEKMDNMKAAKDLFKKGKDKK
jgi:hypothetical protein